MKNDNMFEDAEFNDSFSRAFDKEEAKFEEFKNEKLIISLIGDVNSGKSETINALTGRKLSKVSATAGETIDVVPHHYSENVIIADTPGLNDINQEVSKKAIDFVHKDADIIILFFNAAVGASKPIIDTYHMLKSLNKPIILVLNKIDIWYDDGVFEQESYDAVVSQIKKETGCDVIAISAKKKINIESLNRRIVELLEKNGKDMLFLKVSKYKEEQVKNWINGTAISAFGIGVIPIPGADIIPLTTLQVALALKIAYIYNCKVSKNDVMSLIGSTITGGIGKQIFKWGIQALKGLGWLGGPIGEGAVAVTAGSVAAGITYGFGWACNFYYKNGMQVDLGEVSSVYKEKYNEYCLRNSKNNEAAATI